MTTREKLSLVDSLDSFLRECCRDPETAKDFQKIDAAKLEKLRAFKRLTEKQRKGNEMKTWQIKYKEADHMDADRFMLFNLSDDPRMAPRRVVYREWLAANPACLFRAYADSGSDEFGERGYSDLSGPEWLRWFDLRNKH